MDLKVNGQPISKLVYNADNFRKLKEAYEEAMELLVKLNAKLTIDEKAGDATTKPTVSKPKRSAKPKAKVD